MKAPPEADSAGRVILDLARHLCSAGALPSLRLAPLARPGVRGALVNADAQGHGRGIGCFYGPEWGADDPMWGLFFVTADACTLTSTPRIDAEGAMLDLVGLLAVERASAVLAG
jgi:hypothetical protein